MKNITTHIVDDLDGTPDATTHTISLDGRTIDIDLSDTNTDQLYELLDPYFAKGQPVIGARKPPTKRARPQRPPTKPHHKTPTTNAAAPAAGTPAAVRAWWADHVDTDDLPTWQARGAIPAAVLRAWEHRDATTDAADE
jgi:hypothetical protein